MASQSSARRRRRWRLAAGLVAFAVIWFFINGSVEGPILLVLSWNHSVTTADLLSVAAVLLAGWVLRPRQ